MNSKCKRPLHGVLLLDKPQGLSSNHALQRAKRLLGAAKAGHTGSLDPLATGMLPLCFGEATKFSQVLLDADKCYEVTLQLGVRTDSFDAEGTVLSTLPVPAFSDRDWDAIVQRFTGPLLQMPPMYSALKHQGQPLYKLARRGIEIERKARPITIHQFDLLARRETSARLRVHCSKGTYIRTLVDDIGQQLGCGAHVTQLRRVFVHPFTQSTLYTLETLQGFGEDSARLEACLLPVDSALQSLPALQLTRAQCDALQKGQVVSLVAGAPAEQVRLYDPEACFIGLGALDIDLRLTPKRLLQQTLRVQEFPLSRAGTPSQPPPIA